MNRQSGKIKIPPYTFVLLLFVMMSMYWIGGGLQGISEQAFELAAKKIPAETTEVRLNDLVPFAWDALYAFGPYEPESAIREMIGVDGGNISEGVSEGQMQIVLVDHQKEKIAANFSGYPEKFGFAIVIPPERWENRAAKITKEENAVFTVTNEDGLVTLIYKQSDAAAP